MKLTLPSSLQEFFTSAMNSFDEDQDVDGALKFLKIDDLQQKFKDLAITLMPHVSANHQSENSIPVLRPNSKSLVSSS